MVVLDVDRCSFAGSSDAVAHPIHSSKANAARHQPQDVEDHEHNQQPKCTCQPNHVDEHGFRRQQEGEVVAQQDGRVSPTKRLMTLRTRMLRMLSTAKGVHESGSNEGGLSRTFVVCVAAVVTCAFAWHAPKAFGESFADHATRLSRSSDPFFQHVAASRLAFVARHAPHALHGDEERTHAIVALMDPKRRRDVRLEAMRAMHILLETSGGDQAMERHRNDIEHALEENNEDDVSSPETVEVAETLRRSMKRTTGSGT